METFTTDAGYTLEVDGGWDRDGELEFRVDNQDLTFRLYFNKAQVERLRNALSIQLGDV